MGEQAIDRGSLMAIFGAEDPSTVTAQPVLQCVHVKPIAPQEGAPQRYRVVFSDVTNFVQSMLATQANHVVESGKLRKGCFVRLTSFQANSVKGRKILIVMDLEVLEEYGEAEKIGNPEGLEIKDEEPSKPTTISSGGFYGGQQKPAAPPQQSAPAARSAPSNGSHGNIYPIDALSPYGHKWTIKARVTAKSDIRTWHNKNGEGKLFSVNLLDESGEIKATGFKDQCDAFYDLFQEGSVYYVSSPCRVQLAKKQFTNLSNDYELTFERDTLIEKAEDQDDVPQIRYSFASIADLANIEKDAVVDAIGVLTDVGETQQIVSKTTAKPFDKRELTIVDQSQYQIRLTIWGKQALNFDSQPDSVIAFKGVKVSDFGGRSLSLLSSGTMSINPEIEEAYTLKGWYDAHSGSAEFAKHTNAGLGAGAAGGQRDQTKTVLEVKEENLGMTETPDYFSIKATVMFIRSETFSYPACRSEGCNKKVLEMDGEWRCERCDRSWPEPEHRYIMSINVSDHTGQMWLSCFDDSGRLLMGRPADEVVRLRDEDPQAAEAIFQAAMCQEYVFRCRARLDSMGDTQRVRYQVSSATPVNFVNEAAKLMKLIKMYD